MHIPDGYISPATAVVMYAAAAPFWVRASQKVKTMLTGRSVPMIALFSAFSFVIMMFNVPLLGGTTGHAVGAALAAIVLGPWPAVLAVSIALIIQAIFFGDGGILAIGANCFTMAIVMVFVSYYVYRWVSGRSAVGTVRRVAAAAIAGYVGINVAAFVTSLLLGIQPLLSQNAAGQALYFPYGLNVAIPAMMGSHLLIAGFIEAGVTGLVVAWLGRSNPQMLEGTAQGTSVSTGSSRWGWVAMLVMVVLTPIGLLAPGTAWGEWGREELEQIGLGYIPAGFDRWSSLWSAPMPDYEIPFLSNPTIAYILSAVVGVALSFLAVALIVWVVRMLTRRRTEGQAA